MTSTLTLTAGDILFVRFGCDCGDNHTETPAVLTVRSATLEGATVVDDDGIEFAIWFDHTEALPWRYGSDSDPVIIHARQAGQAEAQR